MSSHKSKKRKTGHQSSVIIDTTKPSAIYTPSKGREYTLSVALPGSIIANAQTHDLKTLLAGQIARALAVFCVDEVIVFDDGQSHGGGGGGANDRRSSGYNQQRHPRGGGGGDDGGGGGGGGSGSIGNSSSASAYTGFADPNHFLAHLLAYLETPPHLRRLLFPLHPDLRTAGTLNSLDMPHHLRAHEWCRYREGVALGPPSPSRNGQEGADGNDDGQADDDGDRKASKKKDKKDKKKKKHGRSDEDESAAAAVAAADATTLIEVGFDAPVEVPGTIGEHSRVTVDFGPSGSGTQLPPHGFQAGGQAGVAVVAPSAPCEHGGYYWGYQVRSAASLSAVFTEAPFDGGYDLTWGTSERGKPLDEVVLAGSNGGKVNGGEANGGERNGNGASTAMPVPEFRHMLVVFGGVAGLEVAARADKELAGLGVEGPEKLFDYWVNLCPGQGSRTIRTEEAIWLGLMGLRGVVQQKGVQ